MATSLVNPVVKENTACAGFTADTYDRYVLGFLDAAERAGVDRELEQQCPACIAGVQRSINLWLVFAGSLQQVEPAADFRARLVRIAELSNRILTVPKHEKGLREPAILISGLVVICLVLGTLLIFTFLAGQQSSRLMGLQRAKAESVSYQSQAAEALVTPPPISGSEKQLQDDLSAAKAQIQQYQATVQRYVASEALDKQRTSGNKTLVNALESPGVRLLTFKSADETPSTAYAFVIEDAKIVFVASKLPAAHEQRQYQLWLVRKTDHHFVSLKVFEAADGVPTVITYEDKETVGDLAGLVVTEEPLNGSSEPTGERVLETAGVPQAATPAPE